MLAIILTCILTHVKPTSTSTTELTDISGKWSVIGPRKVNSRETYRGYGLVAQEQPKLMGKKSCGIEWSKECNKKRKPCRPCVSSSSSCTSRTSKCSSSSSSCSSSSSSKKKNPCRRFKVKRNFSPDDSSLCSFSSFVPPPTCVYGDCECVLRLINTAFDENQRDLEEIIRKRTHLLSDRMESALRALKEGLLFYVQNEGSQLVVGLNQLLEGLGEEIMIKLTKCTSLGPAGIVGIFRVLTLEIDSAIQRGTDKINNLLLTKPGALGSATNIMNYVKAADTADPSLKKDLGVIWTFMKCLMDKAINKWREEALVIAEGIVMTEVGITKQEINDLINEFARKLRCLFKLEYEKGECNIHEMVCDYAFGLLRDLDVLSMKTMRTVLSAVKSCMNCPLSDDILDYNSADALKNLCKEKRGCSVFKFPFECVPKPLKKRERKCEVECRSRRMCGRSREYSRRRV